MARPNPTHTHTARADDTFELYDLKVEVVCPPNERILCGAKDGDYFLLEGEMLKLPPSQGIFYSLSAVLPLLAAKQRSTYPNDWMTTDSVITCPDPHCKSRLKITLTKKRVFSRSAVTAVPLAHGSPSKEDRINGSAFESLVEDSKRTNTAYY